jgi:hypothetical protein
MSKHTPGPWFVDKAPSTLGGNGFSVHGHGGAAMICTAFPGGSTDRIESVAEANARLIAAAPDLLDALQGLVALLPDPELDADEVQREYVLVAKAAIAKAGAA